MTESKLIEKIIVLKYAIQLLERDTFRMKKLFVGDYLQSMIKQNLNVLNEEYLELSEKLNHYKVESINYISKCDGRIMYVVKKDENVELEKDFKEMLIVEKANYIISKQFY